MTTIRSNRGEGEEGAFDGTMSEMETFNSYGIMLNAIDRSEHPQHRILSFGGERNDYHDDFDENGGVDENKNNDDEDGGDDEEDEVVSGFCLTSSIFSFAILVQSLPCIAISKKSSVVLWLPLFNMKYYEFFYRLYLPGGLLSVEGKESGCVVKDLVVIVETLLVISKPKYEYIDRASPSSAVRSPANEELIPLLEN
jgi:hypothetical protein